jgi:hypothetical protein
MPTGGAQDTDNNPLDQRGEKYKPLDCDCRRRSLYTRSHYGISRLTYYIPTVQPNHQSWSACGRTDLRVDRCSASSLRIAVRPGGNGWTDFYPSQCNNMSVFPWLGVGATVCGAKERIDAVRGSGSARYLCFPRCSCQEISRFQYPVNAPIALP